MEAIEQINGYVNDGYIRSNSNAQILCGETGLTHIAPSSFEFSLQTKVSTDQIEDVTYTVEYQNMQPSAAYPNQAGLIIYEFTRTAKKYKKNRDANENANSDSNSDANSNTNTDNNSETNSDANENQESQEDDGDGSNPDWWTAYWLYRLVLALTGGGSNSGDNSGSGGGVKLGESSGDCIKRELFEEIGISVQSERLAVVCENFFKIDISGSKEVMHCHTIEFYYLVRLDDSELDNLKSITDEGEELVLIPLDRISSVNIMPSFIRKSISQIVSSSEILHFVEETDR